MNSVDLSKIPEAACQFHADIFNFGDNGEDAKSMPIRLLARSSKPIEHWYWGKVAHDLNGYKLTGNGNRIAIDFDHNTSEAIGYANKFEVESDGLYLGGTLKSVEAGDRADKVMKQMKAGIPYQASINFAGDDLEVERVEEMQFAEVNGERFDGPGLIIRKWNLRGVAVCLYGADQNTSAKSFSNGGTVAAKLLTQTKTEAGNMSEPTTEAAPVVADENEPKQLSAVVEGAVAEGAAPVAEPVEANEPETTEPADTDKQFSAKEFAQIVAQFGAEVAAETVTNGGGYLDALQLSHKKQGDRIAELEKTIAELSANKGKKFAASPVAFSDAETSKRKKMSFEQAVEAKLKGEL